MMQQFIPVQNGQLAFVKEQRMISDVFGMVAYEVVDGHVVFSEDITELSGRNIQAVDMQLVVKDFDHYGEYDLLPIPASMAADIVMEVFTQLAQTPPNENKVDPAIDNPSTANR